MLFKKWESPDEMDELPASWNNGVRKRKRHRIPECRKVKLPACPMKLKRLMKQKKR